MAELGASAKAGLSPRIILATALAAGLAPLNSTMLSVALRPIGVAFTATEATLTSALVTSYLVTSIVAGAPCGKLADGLGHRRALLMGQIAFAMGSLMGMLAPNVATLAVARIAMAAAGSLVIPSGMALVRAEVPVEARGRVFGMFGATMAFSATLGPVVGGQLVALFGWRSLFAVNLVIVPVSALLAGLPKRGQSPSGQPAARKAFDWLGTILLGSSLTSLVVGAGRGRSPNFLLLGLAVVLMLAFIAVERRTAFPVVDLGLFRIRTYVASFLVIALQNLAMYSLLFELPLVCGIALKATGSRTGPLLIAMMAPTILLSPIAGRLADKWGPRLLALIGTFSSATGVLLLLAIPLTSLLSAVPGLVMIGVGLGAANAPAQSAGMSSVSPAQSASAAGLSSTMRYLGGVLGSLLLGVLFSRGATPDNVLTIHREALWCFLVALLLAAASAAMLPSRLRR